MRKIDMDKVMSRDDTIIAAYWAEQLCLEMKTAAKGPLTEFGIEFHTIETPNKLVMLAGAMGCRVEEIESVADTRERADYANEIQQLKDRNSVLFAALDQCRDFIVHQYKDPAQSELGKPLLPEARSIFSEIVDALYPGIR
jgi:hypothetical protein